MERDVIRQCSGSGPSRLRNCLTDSHNVRACLWREACQRTAMDPVLEWISITGVHLKFQPNLTPTGPQHRPLVKPNGELEISLLRVARASRRTRRSAGAD